jgi:hypothetical protein
MGDFKEDSSPIPCGLRFGLCGVAFIYIYYPLLTYNSIDKIPLPTYNSSLNQSFNQKR